MLVPALIVLALVLAVAIAALVSYVRYAKSPAAVWKRQVRAAVADQEARLRAARRQLAAGDDADRGLRDEYLGRQLRGLGVEELAKYPGIGPVTVARLREAGLTNVADCGRVRLTSVAGIGPSRQSDLREALRKIRREAESRFDAGASREAVEYAAELKRRDADRQSRRAKAQEAVCQAQAALDYLREPARLARRVTWLGHVIGHPPAGLTDEVMKRPLTPPMPQPEEKVTPPPSAAPTVVPAAPPVLSSPRSGGRGEKDTSASASSATTSSPPVAPASEDSPLGRLRVVAGFGLAVAKADGRIAAAERRQVRAFLARRYAPTADLVSQLDPLLAEIENDLPTLGDALWNVRRVVPESAWPDLHQFAVSVADASGGERNAREAECLARIAEELGIGPRSPLPGPAVPTPAPSSNTPLTEADCRAALDIDPGVALNVDLIRRQYRLLAERFAAQKFASHGPEFARMAAEKRERVERAARQLLAGYNEPLETPKAEPPADPRHNPDLDAVFGV